jgi:integrase
MPRNGHVPKLCWHSGQKRYYLNLKRRAVYYRDRKGGRSTWPERPARVPDPVQRWYDRAVGRWLVERETRPVPVGVRPLVSEVWLAYKAYIDGPLIYVKAGKKTTEPATILTACRVVARLHGDQLAEEYTAADLKAVRAEFIRLGWARKHINKQLVRVRGMFAWAVSEKLIPAAILNELKTVRRVSIAEAKARGIPLGQPVRAVPRDVIRATLAERDDAGRPIVPAHLAAMVRIHHWTGCRAAAGGRRTRRSPCPTMSGWQLWCRHTGTGLWNSASSSTS